MSAPQTALECITQSAVAGIKEVACYLINEHGQEIKITEQMVDSAVKLVRERCYVPRVLK
jgi:hypothetical protein